MPLKFGRNDCRNIYIPGPSPGNGQRPDTMIKYNTCTKITSVVRPSTATEQEQRVFRMVAASGGAVAIGEFGEVGELFPLVIGGSEVAPINTVLVPGTPAFMKFLCSMYLSPKSMMALYAEDPDTYTPDEDAAAFSLAALAPQASSADITISDSDDESIPRVYVMTLVRLDSGTSFADIILNFFVGGNPVGKLDGAEVNPDTDNGCIRGLCLFQACLGMNESFVMRVRNQGSVALGAGATIRVKTKRILPGQPGWSDCWEAFCTAAGYTEGAAACACNVEG